MHIVWALIIGLTFAVCFFGAACIWLVPGFFGKLWRGVTRPLGAALVLGWALLAMGAITQVSLTTQVSGILPSANGGTNIAYFAAAGPTAVRTYTFPDASTTVLTTNAVVTVPQGGLGVGTLGAHGTLIGEGTGNVVASATGSSGQCWISNGSSSDPTWQACPSGGNFSDNEIPSGTINGSTTAFTLAHTPNPAASLNCYENGVHQIAGGSDFTLSTATITYGTAPPIGTTLNCSYRY